MTVVEFTNKLCVLTAFWRGLARCGERRGNTLPHVSHLSALDLIFFQATFIVLWRTALTSRLTWRSIHYTREVILGDAWPIDLIPQRSWDIEEEVLIVEICCSSSSSSECPSPVEKVPSWVHRSDAVEIKPTPDHYSRPGSEAKLKWIIMLVSTRTYLTGSSDLWSSSNKDLNTK